MSLTTLQPRTQSFASLSPHGFHKVVYYEWGDPAAREVVVCVHGLARNGRDFDVLAERLSARRRVLSVDMPGRGASEWLRDPGDYTFPTYLATLTALFARANVDKVDFVGTSMGGLLGMVLAAQPGTPDCAPGDQRRGPGARGGSADAHRHLCRSRSALCHLRRNRRLHTQAISALRTVDRVHSGCICPPPTRGSSATAGGAWSTTRALPSRSATKLRLPTCGRYGTRYAARRW